MPAVTGLSPRREQQIQERQLLRFERRFDGRLRTEIRKAMTELAEANGSTGKTAQVLAEHKDRLRKILAGEWQAAFGWYGNRLFDALEKSGSLKLEYKEVGKTEAFDEAVQNWVRIYGSTKVTQITNTTKEQAQKIINNVIAQGAEEGWSERALAKQISEAMAEQSASLSQFRSRMIARTETHGAANAANQIAAEASDIPMRKEWVSSGGERTRSSHAAADGQTVGLNDSFTVEGESLEYPGDPNGSAGNVINCRCASVMVTA